MFLFKSSKFVIKLQYTLVFLKFLKLQLTLISLPTKIQLKTILIAIGSPILPFM